MATEAEKLKAEKAKTTAANKELEKAKKSNTELAGKLKANETELAEAKKAAKEIEANSSTLLTEKQTQIDAANKELNEVKKELTKALENPALSDEQAEALLDRAKRELRAEMKAEQDEKEEKEKAEAKAKTPKPFVPAEQITHNKAIFLKVNNPTGYMGAFNEKSLEINQGLFKARNIKTLVHEIPEPNRKGEEFYLLYRGATVSIGENVQVKVQ